MNKNSMNLGQYNSRHVIKHVTLKYCGAHLAELSTTLKFLKFRFWKKKVDENLLKSFTSIVFSTFLEIHEFVIWEYCSDCLAPIFYLIKTNWWFWPETVFFLITDLIFFFFLIFRGTEEHKSRTIQYKFCFFRVQRWRF